MGSTGRLSHRNTTRFNQFKNHYMKMYDPGATASYSYIPTVLTNVTSSLKYYTGSCTYKQYVYFFPHNETRFLRVDTSDDSYSFIGNTSGVSCRKAMLAPNGFIYILTTGLVVMKFNPEDESLTSFGTLETAHQFGTIVGTDIYIIPAGNAVGTIKKVDTNTDTISDYAPTGWNSARKHNPPVLGLDNRIYGTTVAHLNGSDGTDGFYIIDTKTNIVTYKNTTLTQTVLGLTPWYTGTLNPINGKLYFADQNDSRWMIYDTINDVFEYANIPVSINPAGTPNNADGTRSIANTIGPNGNMYNVPWSDDYRVEMEELDILTDTVTKIGDTSVILGGGGYSGGNRLYYAAVMAMNGNIYAAPSDNSGILKITFSGSRTFDENFVHSPWYNSN